MKKLIAPIFALGWAAATYFIVVQFEQKVTNIATTAANVAATETIKQLRPEIDKLCQRVQEAEPQYDRDDVSPLCVVVANLSE